MCSTTIEMVSKMETFCVEQSRVGLKRVRKDRHLSLLLVR